jgi:hypothetical protein
MSGFFLETISPKPLSILLGLFRIFSKIRGDIRSSRWKKFAMTLMFFFMGLAEDDA